MEQRAAFESFEADAWFRRNRELIDRYNPSEDKVIQLLKKYRIDCKDVLEIGSSSGYRLQSISEIFNCRSAIGVEPSFEAITYGAQRYNSVKFVQSTADDLKAVGSESVNVLIMGFVYYVIDRALVLKVMAEIDRVLKDQGFLVLVDFFSEVTRKNKYHHIDAFDAYSFKQNYDEVFTATKLYHLLDRSTFDHTSGLQDANEGYANLYSISLLKKDLHESYK